MRGIEPIIAAVLVIAISIAGIAIVLQYSQPSVTRLSDISVYNQAKDVMKQIDNNFGYVIIEGEGSTRVLHLSIGGGYYMIDNVTDSLKFSMDTSSNLIGDGVSNIEGNLNITGKIGKILITRSYPTVDITTGASFSSGNRNIIIRNEGFDSLEQKQLISVTVS
jgi:hypothetical protein